MPQEFAPEDFLKALDEGALPYTYIARQGMVKEVDDDSKAIHFAEGSICEHWIKIPLSMIDKIEFIRFVPCKDHQHPYVILHLKEPADNPQATVFAKLLQTAQEPGSLLQIRVMRKRTARSGVFSTLLRRLMITEPGGPGSPLPPPVPCSDCELLWHACMAGATTPEEIQRCMDDALACFDTCY